MFIRTSDNSSKRFSLTSSSDFGVKPFVVLRYFKHDTNTYMRVNNAFDNIVNVVRLDDGMPFIFQNDTKVEKYNAILTIEKKG